MTGLKGAADDIRHHHRPEWRRDDIRRDVLANDADCFRIHIRRDDLANDAGL